MRYLLLISILFSTHSASCQKIIVLNPIQKNTVQFYIGFQKLNEQFNYIQAAQKFTAAKAGGILQEVNIYRLILDVNDGNSSIGEPSSTTFLLKIYGVDSLTGSPGASLINQPLTIKNGENRKIKIDLSKYKIRLTGKTFFVGIEWLFNERNQRLMFAKMGEVIKGDRYDQAALIYQPFLGMVKNDKITSDAWVMTPEHKWKLYTYNLPYMTDLSITAYVRY